MRENNQTIIIFNKFSGNFAIWLDSDLFHGSSRASDTFNNPCLSNAEQFECLYFEVWGK